MKLLFLTTRRASALLTTFLVTSLIMLIALGLAQLITGDIRTGSDFVRDGKALYMAESGLERGMLALKGHLPGYQPADFKSFSKDLDYFVTLLVKTNDIPHVDAADVGQDPTKAYNVLSYQHSVSIPLFTVSGEGATEVATTVKDFLVKYYVHFGTNFKGSLVQQDIDILRWKIVGINTVTKKTESIGDFTATSDRGSATQPNCFGTKSDIPDDAIGTGCILDKSSTRVSSDISVPNVTHIDCNWQQARSYYFYKSSAEVTTENCYPISDFLSMHSQNYLVLTNLVNPDTVNAAAQMQADLSKIYYRVVTSEPVMRDKVVIQSDGHSGGIAGVGGSTKHLDLALDGNIFLPAFHFSIYRTDPWYPGSSTPKK